MVENTDAFALGPPSPPEPAKKGLFVKKPAEKPLGPSPELERQLNTLAGRLRVSEERYSELRKKLIFVEQNMITNHKKVMAEVKMLASELSELKHTITAVEDRIITIIKELQLTARKEDIDVMKRYVELWDPTKFVTIDKLYEMLEEKGKSLKEETSLPEEKE